MNPRPAYYNTQSIDIVAFLAIHGIEPVSIHRMIGADKVEFSFEQTPKLTEIVMLFSTGLSECNAVRLLNLRQRAFRAAREARGRS